MAVIFGDNLKQVVNVANNGLQGQILDFCRHVAGSASITAIAQVDYFSVKPADDQPCCSNFTCYQKFSAQSHELHKNVKQ